MTHTDCPACTALRGITQCNRCRVERPNKQTQTRNLLWQMVGEGMTPAEAEAALGVRPVLMG